LLETSGLVKIITDVAKILTSKFLAIEAIATQTLKITMEMIEEYLRRN